VCLSGGFVGVWAWGSKPRPVFYQSLLLAYQPAALQSSLPSLFAKTMRSTQLAFVAIAALCALQCSMAQQAGGVEQQQAPPPANAGAPVAVSAVNYEQANLTPCSGP